jgi:hypothetical protein
MKSNSKNHSPLDFIEGIRNRKDFLITVGRVIERCTYSSNGSYDGVKPTKVIDLMSGMSYTQYETYRDIALGLGLIMTKNGGFIRTDDGHSVLNDLYHIGTIFGKNNNSNNGHNNPTQ